jgi:hypothetical protein
VWLTQEQINNSAVIPGELAIKLQPEADPPRVEARPGIQEFHYAWMPASAGMTV